MEKKIEDLYEFRHQIADELLKAYKLLTTGEAVPINIYETFFNGVKEIYLKGVNNE